MENGLINTYHYDQYGYYEGVVTTQVLDGAALMPPCCIATAPEVKEGFMENGLINTYHYDQYGYYEGVVTTQVLDGAALMPPCCIATAPEVKEGFFYKINDTDDGWIAEAKPKSAKDCIGLVVKHEDNSDRGCELKKLMQDFCDADSEHYRVKIAEAKPKSAKDCIGLVVKHEDNSDRGCELKKLMQDFCDADSEHYRVKRDENLAWSVEEIPEKTLDELKEAKLTEIANEAGKYDQYKCDSMYLTSSVESLIINADARSQNNIRALIEHYTEPVTFKTYDNTYHEVTKEQLEIMLKECVANGESLYQQKWALQLAVSQAKTKEDLNKINVTFTMMNFEA